MAEERWHAVIYYRSGRVYECAYSSNRTLTARMAQQIYDQELRTAIKPFFAPMRMEIVRDR